MPIPDVYVVLHNFLYAFRLELDIKFVQVRLTFFYKFITSHNKTGVFKSLKSPILSLPLHIKSQEFN